MTTTRTSLMPVKIGSTPSTQPAKPAAQTAPVAMTSAPATPQSSAAWAPKPKQGGVGDWFKKIGDDFANIAAKSVGYAELAGLRYPVSHYSEKVSVGLTRGSRLSDDSGYQKLHDQGFKTIVDLTAEGTENKDAALKAGLKLMQVPTIDNSPPTVAQMREMLNFITAPENAPAYVHCEAGVGRTGVAVACYRMAVEGWSPDKASAEAAAHGCHVPSQLDFIQQFGAALAAGQMPEFKK